MLCSVLVAAARHGRRYSGRGLSGPSPLDTLEPHIMDGHMNLERFKRVQPLNTVEPRTPGPTPGEPRYSRYSVPINGFWRKRPVPR